MKKIKKWELLEEEDVSPSKWFPFFKHKVKLPNGTIVDDYYISKLGDVAMVLLITDKKEVVFVKQYKHGAGEVILELPAGRIGNKTPKEMALQELEEETGMITNEVEKIGEIWAAPSKDTTTTHGFISNNVHLTREQVLDETEDIEVVLIPSDLVEEKIRSGEIRSSDTLALLYIAKLKHPELFE